MIRRFARPYARAIMDAAGSPAKANELRGELMRFASALRGSRELRELYANPAIDQATTLDDHPAARAEDEGVRPGCEDARGAGAQSPHQRPRRDPRGARGVRERRPRRGRRGSAPREEPRRPTRSTSWPTTLSKKVGKKVELDIRTDPKLLGGFVVKIGSEIWDASVIGKINKFRESLS